MHVCLQTRAEPGPHHLTSLAGWNWCNSCLVLGPQMAPELQLILSDQEQIVLHHFPVLQTQIATLIDEIQDPCFAVRVLPTGGELDDEPWVPHTYGCFKENLVEFSVHLVETAIRAFRCRMPPPCGSACTISSDGALTLQPLQAPRPAAAAREAVGGHFLRLLSRRCRRLGPARVSAAA